LIIQPIGWFTVEKVEGTFIVVTPKSSNTSSSKRGATITITTVGYRDTIIPVTQAGAH